MIEFLKKIADRFPTKKGRYMTNLGELEFDSKTFLIVTGSKKFPTVIDYWLEPAEAAGKPPIVSA